MDTQNKSSFIINYLLYLSTQILNLLTPFFILPIISRRLGISGLGSISYVLTISQVFITIASAGLLNYGNRKISGSMDVSKDFKLLFFIQLTTSLLSLCFYAYYIFVFEAQYYQFFLIAGLGIIANVFDFSWYFIAVNQVRKVALRNTLLKLCMIVGTLIFVKTVKDIDLYLYIYFGSTLILNLFMLLNINSSYFNLRQLVLKEIIEEFKKVTLFFAPTILMLIYSSFDKIFLADRISHASLAIYDNSLKIITILCVLTASLSPLMVAKMSSMKGDKDLSKLIGKSLSFVCFISFPMVFGIISIANELVVILFGKAFYEMVSILKILAPIIVFIGLGDILVNQIIISTHKDKQYLMVMIIMVVLTILLNLSLIPYYSHYGAAVSNTLSHLLILSIEFYYCRKFFTRPQLFEASLLPLLSSFIMFIILYNISLSNIPLINISLKICLGFVSYTFINALLGLKFQKEIIGLLVNKFKLYYEN